MRDIVPPRGRDPGLRWRVYPLDAEDPPKMFAMLAACAALSLVVMALAVPRELEARRRARLHAPGRARDGRPTMAVVGSHHAPTRTAHAGQQSRSSWCRGRQARTEHGRETGVSPRFGRAGLAFLLAILEEVLSPWVCQECGRARWLP
jgi:hypothetical protein